MKYLFEILSLLGAIGLFLYGMKLMSKTLQRLAGENLRKSLSVFTSNKTNSIFSGLFLTGAIQYSSVVITMVVGFVSAGLLSVKKSIGIVFGANIGTTLKVTITDIETGYTGFYDTSNNKFNIKGQLTVDTPPTV